MGKTGLRSGEGLGCRRPDPWSLIGGCYSSNLCSNCHDQLDSADHSLVRNYIWGIVKIMVPFWVPIIIRGLIRGLI